MNPAYYFQLKPLGCQLKMPNILLLAPKANKSHHVLTAIKQTLMTLMMVLFRKKLLYCRPTIIYSRFPINIPEYMDVCKKTLIEKTLKTNKKPPKKTQSGFLSPFLAKLCIYLPAFHKSRSFF